MDKIQVNEDFQDHIDIADNSRSAIHDQPDSISKSQQDADDNSTVIQSVADIHDRLSDFSGNRRAVTAYAHQLYQTLVSNSNTILGVDSDYHNLSVEFSKRSCVQYALGAAKLGAQRFPFSTTLLADIILYGQKACSFDDCKRALNRLYQIPYSYWEWRSFVFAIDYLKDGLSFVQKISDYETDREKAFELIEKFKETIPHEERSYVAEAEMYIRVSDYDKAIDVLEEAIRNINVSPQCCIKLADLYLEFGKYEKVVEIAAIGVRATAQDQPTASIPYFYYISALAKDAMIHNKVIDKAGISEDPFYNYHEIEGALKDYEIAARLFEIQNRYEYSQTIEMRSVVLKMELGLPENKDSQKPLSNDNLMLKKVLSRLIEKDNGDS